MENINVRGLPEPVAEAIEAMVRRLRQAYPAAKRAGAQRECRELPTVAAGAIGRLSRSEIYDDRV